MVSSGSRAFTKRQPVRPALSGSFKSPRVFLGFGYNGTQRDALPRTVECHEGEIGRRSVPNFAAVQILDPNFHANLHRSSEYTIDLRLQPHQRAKRHGMEE